MVAINKSYLASAVFGGISRCLSIGIRFISVPIIITLLSQERYGLWLVISALVGWLGFSDLGIPAALQNRLVIVLKEEGEYRANTVVSYALRLLILLGLSIVVVGCVLAFGVPWAQIFKVDISYGFEFSATICVCVGALAIGLPSRVGSVIFNAHGKFSMQPFSDIAAQLSSLTMLLLAWWFEWKSLIILASCSLAGIIAGPAFLSLWAIKSYKYSICGSTPNAADKKAILGKGVFFFLTIIGELLILQSDAFIIGNMKGAQYVPLFLLPMALFLNLLHLQNIFLRPLWPILTASYISDDTEQFKIIVIRSIKLSVGGGLAFLFFCVTLGDWFMRLWTKQMVELNPAMAWGLGLYGLAAAFDNAINACLNSVGMIEMRFTYILVVGFLKVVVAIFVLKYFDITSLLLAYALMAFGTAIPFSYLSLSRLISPRRH